ncbi:MAG: oxidoreductase [Burkholderiaceae bacterium]|jgi:predicted DsbA family dithiol-disulfide isomerase|nr:oxidoreductase [Burkholderiaceae bacterium]
MRIDFVSDVTCPWCAIGFTALERALERLGGEVPVELHLQPFELNPDMPPEGEDIVRYMGRKYGLTAEQVAERRAVIRERGAAVGFDFGPRTHVWNTFDAHRMLHWAGLEGRGRELKRALLAAYHGRGENPGSHEVLLRLAGEAGLDAGRASDVLEGGGFAAEVREQERHWQRLGIRSVPSVIVERRHLIQGGQPVEVFENALREIAAGREPA